MVYHLKNKKKKTFNELVAEKSFEFQNLKEKGNLNNFIYRYKTEGISRKDFNDYQNLIDFFINLRDGNINPTELLKDQINFKSDLSEIKIERSNTCNTKCSNIFRFKRKKC